MGDKYLYDYSNSYNLTECEFDSIPDCWSNCSFVDRADALAESP